MRYSILGPLEVRDDDGSVLEPGTPKQRAVLALLLVDPNTVVSTDRLVEELWDGDPPSGATHTVQTYVSSLRKALDNGASNGSIVTRKPGYLVEIDHGQLDVEEFEAAVADGRAKLSEGYAEDAAALLSNGLALWRGQALADVADEAATLRDEARRLDELRLNALELRIEADIAAGRHRAVIGELETLTNEQPLRESLWGSLMLALYRSGRQADALRAFGNARRVLGEELGIDPSAELRELEERMLLQDQDLLTAAKPPVDLQPGARNPYKGLRPYEQDDAADFYGRNAEVARLVEALGEHEFLALVAPSGSGKSSILKAGILPALRGGALPGSDAWLTAEMVPDDDPFQELSVALKMIANDGDELSLEELRGDGGAAVVESALPGSDSRLVLILDQFEEVFTLVTDATIRGQFLTLLEKLAESDRVSIVVTLRADFLDHALRQPEIAGLLQAGMQVIVPLDADELRAAAVGPAEGVGIRVAPELVEALVADVGSQPGMLPMMQYALTELFDRRQGPELTLEAYREIGGVSRAIAGRAENLYKELDAEGRGSVRQVMLRLVNVGEGGALTRRRVPRARLHGMDADPRTVDRILESFGRRRLLTFDLEPGTGTPTVEIAHEALLSEWKRLARWIAELEDDLLIHRRLELAALEWSYGERDPGYLLTGARLAEAEDWTPPRGINLTELEREFLELSVAAETARREHEDRLDRRARQRSRLLIVVLAVATVIALALTAWAIQGQTEARQQADLALARGLIAGAHGNLSIDPELSILLGLEALDRARSSGGQALTEVDEVLRQALAAMRTVETVPGVVVSTDAGGRRVATLDDEGAARVWPDGVGGDVIELPVAEGSPKDDGLEPPLAMTSDAIAYLTSADTPVVFDLATGSEIVVLEGHTGLVESVALNQSGTRALSTSVDGTARLWSVPDGEVLRQASAESNGGAFSDDGSLVAYGDYSSETTLGSIFVWDAETGGDFGTLCCHQGNVFALAFSPDGATIASVGFADDTLRLWSVADGTELWSVKDPAGGFSSAVAFAADGSTIATGSRSGAVRVWDSETGEVVLSLEGHRVFVTSVAFTQHDELLSASADGTTRLWNVGAGTVEIQPDVEEFEVHPEGRPADGLSLAYSDAGDRLVAAFGRDEAKVIDLSDPTNPILTVTSDVPGGVIIWGDFTADGSRVAIGGVAPRVFDLETGEVLATLEDPDTEFNRGVAFSPDGTRLVASGIAEDSLPGGAPKIWDVDSGTIIHRLQGHTDQVWAVDWSPDGSTVATGGGDAVRVWNPDSGEELYTLNDPDVLHLRFSRDGRLLATGGAQVRVWDVATGDEVANLAGHTGWAFAVGFSPDGTQLVSGGQDGLVKLWDIEGGVEIQTLADHGSEVWGVAWSTDGSIATVGRWGDVRIHSRDLDTLERAARDRVTRSLTDAECRQYLHLVACPAFS